MSPTVHERRNQIRASVGRFERETNAQFTKEELAAVAEAVGHDTGDGRPSKGAMQAGIRRQVGLPDEPGTFTKAELETIADAVR
jgi:hypothetical protein